MPPVGGPQILDIVERRYPNATEQRILLANRSAVGGENVVQVRFFGPVGNTGTGRTPLPNPILANADMTREMREAFPGIAMRRSPLYVQNRYGPFGYAVGRAASGDTCLYAWQRIAGVDNSTLLLRDRGTIQIRFRLCDAVADEERLLYTMYGFTIRAFFSNLQWNPYGAPNAPDATLGASGAPVFPSGAGGFERVIGEAPPPAPPPARPRAPRPAPAPPAAPAPTAVETPPPLPAPIGPVVPPPPGTAAGTRTSGAPAASPAPTPTPETPAPSAVAAPETVVVVPPPPSCAVGGPESAEC